MAFSRHFPLNYIRWELKTCFFYAPHEENDVYLQAEKDV
jgi:hypothetical protein